MKKLLIVIILINTALGLFAQTKISVFVTSKVLKQDYQAFLTDQLVEAFTNSNQYIAVNRSNEIISVLNTVAEFQENGKIDPKQVVNATKQYGETQVCGVNVYQVDDKYVFQASLVDVATAQIVKTVSAYSPKDDWEFDSALEVSRQLTAKLMGMSEKYRSDNDENKNENKKEIIKIEHGGYTYFIHPELGAMSLSNGKQACRDLVVEGCNQSVKKENNKNKKSKNKKKEQQDDDEFNKWRLPSLEEFYAIAEKCPHLLKKKYSYWTRYGQSCYYWDSSKKWTDQGDNSNYLRRILPIMKVKKSDDN